MQAFGQLVHRLKQAFAVIHRSDDLERVWRFRDKGAAGVVIGIVDRHEIRLAGFDFQQLRFGPAQFPDELCRAGSATKLAMQMLAGITDPATGNPVIEPDCARAISAQVQALAAQYDRPVALIVQPPVRRPLAALLRSRADSVLVLSPTVISLPFKLLLFVLVDGWALLMGSLAMSFA